MTHVRDLLRMRLGMRRPSRVGGWLPAIAAALLLAACASTPQASLEAERHAKEFHTHPAASTIYVYRSEFDSLDEQSVLYMDGRLIGATLPGAFFRIDAAPGRHVLHGIGADNGQLAVDTMAGELYFVSLTVIGSHSHFEAVPDAVGKRRVRACCALFENWSPGQRPLLR
jgi:hypothetical protein